MSINTDIRNMLNEKRELYDQKFIAFDGVVDEKEYEISKIKTVFLLKEVNEKRSDKLVTEDWDYVDAVRKDAIKRRLYKHTFPNILRWIELINEEYNRDYREYDDVNNMMGNILKVGIVNIKKTSGGGVSEDKVINEVADRCADIIKNEISLIKPQLVICGGTFHYLKTIFGIKKEDILQFMNGAEYVAIDGIVYLEFPHPGCRVSPKVLFSFAKETLDAAKQKFGWIEKG